jgi:hypothetical protein
VLPLPPVPEAVAPAVPELVEVVATPLQCAL